MNWQDSIKGLVLPKLERGAHESVSSGLCAMEMVAFIERLPHSDSPPCTCPAIAGYVRGVNDLLPPATRQRLLPYLPRLVGTLSPSQQKPRIRYLKMQAVTRVVPLALEFANFQHDAERVRNISNLDQAAVVLNQIASEWAKNPSKSPRLTQASLPAGNAFYTARQLASISYLHSGTGVNLIFRKAAEAASRKSHKVYDAAFEILDGLLAIGPQPEPKSYADVLPELAAMA